MWKQLELEKDSGELRVKKARLYADEDIEDWLVEFLKDSGVNIKSAKEVGHTGKDDLFHAALAFKEQRFLLTKNIKHYFDDRKVPFHNVWGIMGLDVDTPNITDTIATVYRILDIVRFGEVYLTFPTSNEKPVSSGLRKTIA